MVWHFMRIISLEDNSHKMPNPVFWENKKTTIICRLLHLPGDYQRLIRYVGI